MKGGYFLFNGQFHKENESVFNLADLTRRAEGFIEYFRAEHNEILFQESVSRQLLASADTLNFDLTGLIDPEGRLLRKDVSRLLNKNKLYLAAKICIQIYPSDQKINILLSAEEIERGYYPLQEPGLLLTFFKDYYKDSQPASCYYPAGQFIRQAAQRAASVLDKSNLILLNIDGDPCECIGGSFGYIEKKKVYFTSESSGGYCCAIKDQVMQSAKNAGFTPLIKEKINQEDLIQAEEIFLFDSSYGIQKVLGLEDQRYYSTKTRLIAEKLTELAKKYREEKG